MKSNDDLPDVHSLIEVQSPIDQNTWMNLDAYFVWSDFDSPGGDSILTRREIYYLMFSYIIKRDSSEAMYSWAKKQNFFGRWMPEVRSGQTEIFLGEYFSSPAFAYYDIPYYSHSGWECMKEKGMPAEVLFSTDKYFRENSTHDCSVDETFEIFLPCKYFVQNMNLTWNGVEGKWFNQDKQLIAFDPSVEESGPNSCLIDRNALIEFLFDHDLDILWTICGEKMIPQNEEVRGRTRISGAYCFNQGNLEGELQTFLWAP